MSNPSDQSNAKKVQKVKKISSNLYEIHFDRKPKAEKPRSSSSSRVLKAEDLGMTQSNVSRYTPATMPSSVAQAYGSHFRPGVQPGTPLSEGLRNSEKTAPSVAIEGLKKNLNSLNDLHSRLRMMLKELEEFVRA